MNTWMVIASIWVLFAFCVVLFVRGASSRVERKEEARDAAPRGADVSRVKV
ncbi:hypothetical protein [Caballeronia sp. BR00000012568055]|uniref:hypothetical protein n=1 Tax=Caballeronia sp. BR00000012568055 TaxID=2918761 RepID=UPI0023F6AEBE|nr:hypothetical protein [Caballeronia sp. BR00000012568055]